VVAARFHGRLRDVAAQAFDRSLPSRRPAPTTPPQRNCDPSYPDVCLKQGIGDYDCARGHRDRAQLRGGADPGAAPDPFDLDRDGDGVDCEF
jgi:hypothetical protein